MFSERDSGTVCDRQGMRDFKPCGEGLLWTALCGRRETEGMYSRLPISIYQIMFCVQLLKSVFIPILSLQTKFFRGYIGITESVSLSINVCTDIALYLKLFFS